MASLGIRLLDRYVMHEFWQLLLVAVGVQAGILLGADQLQDILRSITQAGMPVRTALTVVGLELPWIATYCLPAGVLMGTLIGFRRLSADAEILALRANGVSFLRLLRAPLLVGLFASLISFSLNEFVVPMARETTHKLMVVGVYNSELPFGQNVLVGVREGEDSSLSRILIAEYYRLKRMSNVVVFDLTRRNAVQIINAASGFWQHGQWVLNQGRVYEISSVNTAATIRFFDRLAIPGMTKFSKLPDKQERRPELLNVWQLSEYITCLKNHSPVPFDLLLLFQRKFSQPLGCLAVVFAGAPLGLISHRARSDRGIICGGLILLAYFVLQSTTTALGENGHLDAVTAAWLPNIVLSAVGIVILCLRVD